MQADGGGVRLVQLAQLNNAVALAVDNHRQIWVNVAVIAGATRQVHILLVKGDARRCQSVRQGILAPGEGQAVVGVGHSRPAEIRTVPGAEVIHIGEGDLHIHGAGQLPPGDFQRVDMRFKMGIHTVLIVPVISAEAPQHEIILIGAGGAQGIGQIRLQGGIGIGVGLPAGRRVLLCLQLGGIIEGQEGLRLRLVVGEVLQRPVVDVHMDQPAFGGSQLVHQVLLVGGVGGSGVAALVIELRQQCLSLCLVRQEGGIGARGGVVGADGLHTVNNVCPPNFRLFVAQCVVGGPVRLPHPLAMEHLMQRRGVHLCGGDQLGDGGLQGGGCGVQLLLGIGGI